MFLDRVQAFQDVGVDLALSGRRITSSTVAQSPLHPLAVHHPASRIYPLATISLQNAHVAVLPDIPPQAPSPKPRVGVDLDVDRTPKTSRE